LRLLEAQTDLAGHNIIGYDIPVLAKLYPWFNPKARLHDTLILARLIYPHLYDIDQAAIRKGLRPPEFTGQMIGAHKLETWGLRMGVLKGSYTGGWEDFTPDMDHYGAQDVVVTRELLTLLLSKGYDDGAMAMECEVAAIIHGQERFGFLFDKAAADALEGILRVRHAVLGDSLRATFPPWVEPERKGGLAVQFVPKRDNAKLGYVKGVPIQKFKTISFNPASRDHIANRLTAMFDWHPVEFTDTGKPKVDETTLSSLDYPEAKLLVEYLTVEKRLGQLTEGKQSWTKAVKADGRIHGRVNTVGAVTRRMTHSSPNMANVPSVSNPYGPECRALFIAGPGRSLVGCDAEGLELRCLAHFLAKHDGGEYGESVVNGSQELGTDVHTVNQKAVGLNSRYNAKTFTYAYLYGAGAQKLGTIFYEDYTDKQKEGFHAKYPPGPTREVAFARIGQRAKRRIETSIPALGKLQEAIKRVAASGRIKLVDGGVVVCRSAHSALNTVLQGSGSVLVKTAIVMLFREVRAAGFAPNCLTGEWRRGEEVIGLCATIHDEIQLEVTTALAPWLGQLAANSMRDAGVALGFRVPTAGAFAIGKNWRETH
jgi:DNA polymerase-1